MTPYQEIVSTSFILVPSVIHPHPAARAMGGNRGQNLLIKQTALLKTLQRLPISTTPQSRLLPVTSRLFLSLAASSAMFPLIHPGLSPVPQCLPLSQGIPSIWSVFTQISAWLAASPDLALHSNGNSSETPCLTNIAEEASILASHVPGI